jgi:EAL and modified HD-GYP domain-containing signal transduction protein
MSRAYPPVRRGSPAAARPAAPRSALHTPPGVECWLGRQPIVDRASRLRGYELLYRDSSANRAIFSDGDLATYHVLSRAVIDLGLDRLVGPHLAFLNVTRRILTDGGYRVLPPDRTVLEVLEDVDVDDAVMAGATEATGLGFKLALDDYTGDSRLAKLGPLLSFVKVDMRAVVPTELPALVEGIRRAAPQAVLLAEKVETADHIHRCRDLGFQLFQGYFVGRPEPQVGRQVRARSVAALRLIAELQRPDLDLEHLDAILRTDPVLSYRLLRMVNSAPAHLLDSSSGDHDRHRRHQAVGDDPRRHDHLRRCQPSR